MLGDGSAEGTGHRTRSYTTFSVDCLLTGNQPADLYGQIRNVQSRCQRYK